MKLLYRQHLHRLLVIAALLVLAVPGFAQKSDWTAKDHYTDGNMRAREQNFEAAIKEYSAAIGLDSNYADAYYNRGTARIRLKDYEPAVADFTKTIALKPDFAKAYANRGIAELELERVADAITDFTKTIALDSGNSSAYFMRAQARMQSGDKDGGCGDLRAAKRLGDPRADRFLRQYCGDSASMAAMGRPEGVELQWPAKEGWRQSDKQDGDGVRIVEYTRNGETSEHWTEIVTTTTYRGMAMGSVVDAMKQLFKQAQTAAQNAKLTVLASDTTAQYPWIIFKIEVEQTEPESQVWQIINGSHDLFMNFWATKKPSVSPEEEKKWVAFLRTAKVEKK